MGDLGKIIVATSFEWLPKVQKIAQSGHTDSITFLQSEAGDITGPFYENMEFHRVSIRVPTTASTSKGDAKNDASLSNVVLRRNKNRFADKKSGLLVRTPTRMSDCFNNGVNGGDVDYIDKGSFQRPTSAAVNVVDGRKFVKFGYSQHEVWNWLHREDVNNVNNNSSVSVEKVSLHFIPIVLSI